MVQLERSVQCSWSALCGAAEGFRMVWLRGSDANERPLLSHWHCRDVDHSAVKLFDDFIKHARHIDAVER